MTQSSQEMTQSSQEITHQPEKYDRSLEQFVAASTALVKSAAERLAAVGTVVSPQMHGVSMPCSFIRYLRLLQRHAGFEGKPAPELRSVGGFYASWDVPRWTSHQVVFSRRGVSTPMGDLDNFPSSDLRVRLEEGKSQRIDAHLQYYVSPCGRFYGSSDEYSEEEWEVLTSNDNIVLSGMMGEEGLTQALVAAGLSLAQVRELLGNESTRPTREN